MKLKVLLAGSYNDYNHRAEYLEEGDVFETTDGYGKTLVMDGYCTANLTGVATPSPASSPAAYSETIPLTNASPKPHAEELTVEADMEMITKIGVFAILLEVSGVNEAMLQKLVEHGYTSLEDFVQDDVQSIKRVALEDCSQTIIKAMQKKARSHIMEARGIS